MIVLFGLYRFARRNLAYRKDFCLSCEHERVSLQVRSFWAGHLFFVPVLPLGFWREWHCSTCGMDPSVRVRTSRSLVKVLAGMVGFVAALVTLAAVSDARRRPADAAIAAGVAVGIWGLTALLVWTLRRMRGVDRTARLAQLTPSTTRECVFCGAALRSRLREGEAVLHCAGCQLDRVG